MTPRDNSEPELEVQRDKACRDRLSTEHTENSQLRGSMLRRGSFAQGGEPASAPVLCGRLVVVQDVIGSGGTRRPVSRVLCRPLTRTRRPFLWTAHRWAVLATYPDGSGRRGPAPAADCSVSGARRPYSVLLQAGLAMPPPLPETRCALTAPFHPYPPPRRRAVCFLWRYPWGRPRRALPAAFSPWSPDFPPSPLRETATAQPSGPPAR